MLYVVLYVALSNDLFIPDIIIPGVPTAGDKFNITCRLAGVAKRLVSGTQVMLLFVSSPGSVSGDQALNGSAFIRSRMFNSVRSSDSGLYTCLSMVALPGGVLSASTNEILQIESKHNSCTCLCMLIMQAYNYVLILCISPFSPAEHHCESLYLSTV